MQIVDVKWVDFLKQEEYQARLLKNEHKHNKRLPYIICMLILLFSFQISKFYVNYPDLIDLIYAIFSGVLYVGSWRMLAEYFFRKISIRYTPFFYEFKLFYWVMTKQIEKKILCNFN